MEGAYDPRAGGDVEDDFESPNGYREAMPQFFNGLNTGAGYAKEVLATAADLDIAPSPVPLENFAAHFNPLFSRRETSETASGDIEKDFFWDRSATRHSPH